MSFQSKKSLLLIYKFIRYFIFYLVIAPTYGFDNFEKALEIYNSGDYEQAKQAFEALAAIGDRSALFNLGVMYYRGESVETNIVKAHSLINLANQKRDPQFTRVLDAITSQMADDQLQDAKILYNQLKSIYSIEVITESIFPKPLADEDCLPEYVPKKVPAPYYPDLERRKGRIGLTEIEVTVSPEGYARDLVVNRSSTNAFKISSIKAAKGLLYEPTEDGQPVWGVLYRYTYSISGVGKSKPQAKTNKYMKELEVIREKAEKGSPVAQYQYASQLNTLRSFKDHLKKLDLQYQTANQWFVKSAKNGLPHAQFEIGQRMLKGIGCEVDRLSAYKWINASAVMGYSPAQRALARTALSSTNKSLEKTYAGIAWLRNASLSGDYIAKLLLAWELSTSLKEIRNGNEALELLKVEPKNYYDDVRILETRAAAYAEIGDFSKAVKLQKRAAKIAKSQKWKIPLLLERLELYKYGSPYRGSYY